MSFSFVYYFYESEVGEILLFLIMQSRERRVLVQLIINVEGRMDWITLDSVIFAPVILYLENWINIEMDPSQWGAFL